MENRHYRRICKWVGHYYDLVCTGNILWQFKVGVKTQRSASRNYKNICLPSWNIHKPGYVNFSKITRLHIVVSSQKTGLLRRIPILFGDQRRIWIKDTFETDKNALKNIKCWLEADFVCWKPSKPHLGERDKMFPEYFTRLHKSIPNRMDKC